MAKPRSHEWEERDAAFRTGARENELRVQILPVWASTQPWGYEGGPADLQVSGESSAMSASEARANREQIGPQVS